MLYNFIINNRNLEVLESRLNTFNPFDVLKIGDFEIRHSNVFAWLLDPKGNHHFGDMFLKKVTSQIVLENEHINPDINLMDIHLGDFSDTIVYREKEKIDILLVSKRNKFLLFIENKINAKESKTQLLDYLIRVKNNKEYKDYTILPVFLTKEGEEPSIEEYAIFSHDSIYKLAKDSLNLRKRTLANDVVEFIEFYLKSLEKTLNMNDDIKILCQKIYEEHKDALETIFKIIKMAETSLKPAFENFISHHKELSRLELTNSHVWFLPNEILSSLPKENNSWIVPYPLAFWIAKKDDTRIKIHIEIGPFRDGSERIKLMEYLESKNYKISPSAKRLESKYTRIFTETEKITNWDDEEELTRSIEEIYKKSEKEIKRIITVLKDYSFNKYSIVMESDLGLPNIVSKDKM